MRSKGWRELKLDSSAYSKMQHKIRGRRWRRWHKITDNTLLAIIVSTLLTALITGIVSVHIKHQNDFNQLIVVIRDTISIDESAYVLCKSFVKNPNQLSSNEYERVFEMNQKIANSIENLAAQQNPLIQYLSKDTYTAISELNCWNNDLYKSGKYLCTKNLKNINRMDNWHNQILMQVKHDQNHNRLLVQIIGGFFQFTKGFFIKNNPERYNFKCDLKKISNY